MILYIEWLAIRQISILPSANMASLSLVSPVKTSRRTSVV